jgi:transcriptional regulator GlxA family with amidase domain
MTVDRKLRVGFLVYDGLQALDLFGPQEAFAAASRYCGADDRQYETLVIGETSRPITTESGISIGVHTDLQNCPRLHTLIIPGGAGSRRENISDNVIDWVRQQTGQAKRIGSVCTGLFILARTGVLDGRLVTTHWQHIEEAKAEFSQLKLETDALYIRQGKIITSAGVTAGIDMALALIEEDLSVTIASLVARELVVFLKRPGGQDQFSSLLKLQEKTQTRFGDLVAWIANNLQEDLCIERLAAKVFLGERQFRRIFNQTFGESPSRAVERIRIDIAQLLLTSKNISIEQISVDTGFRSADAFRRAFYRRTGVNPTDYRQRFNCIS